MSKCASFATVPVFAALALGHAHVYADVQFDHAEVIDVEPIVQRVATVVPRERCWVETVRERRRTSASAPLAGALVGGAIGHALGHRKRNKQVGAVVGAVLGGAIAHDIGRHGVRHRPIRRVRQRVCETVEETSYRERQRGYLVTYRYGGSTHRARMDERPGDTIRVRVQVSPG